MSAYKSVLIGRLLCVHWLKEPAIADVQQLEAETLDTHRRVGQRLLNIAILGPMSVPDGALRARLIKFLQATRETLELSVMVIPSDGLMSPLLRTAVRASVMLTGTREQMRIAASTEEALRIVGPLMTLPASELRRRVSAAGMIVGAGAAGAL